MASKPNPLAGFGRVGCGVFIDGQGADDHRVRTISGFAAECKQQKKLWGKCLAGEKACRDFSGSPGLGKKKEDRLCGESVFF